MRRKVPNRTRPVILLPVLLAVFTLTTPSRAAPPGKTPAPFDWALNERRSPVPGRE
jgi:hypothetical protein